MKFKVKRTKKVSIFLLLLLIPIAFLCEGNYATAISVEITVSELEGADKSCGYDINNLGQVVGGYWLDGAIMKPFLWTEGEGMTHLEILEVNWGGAGVAINELGQIILNGDDSSDNKMRFHCFFWTPDLEPLNIGNLGGDNCYGTDVNNLGQVVGYSQTVDSNYHAFLWIEGEDIVDLGTLGGDRSRALSINDLGQIVGYSHTTPGSTFNTHAFFWSEDTGMIDLGTLEGQESRALAINDIGQVVGCLVTAQGEDHIFIWSEETGMIDLGNLGVENGMFYPQAINNFGQIAGTYLPYDLSSSNQALFWDPEVGMINIGSYFEDGSEVNAINDLGQVVGNRLIKYEYYFDRFSVLWDVSISYFNTPDEGIEYLASEVDALVEDGVLNGGQGNALILKLRAAERQISKGNSNAAHNILQALINQVNAFIDAMIFSEEVGNLLIDSANELIALLE